ncbi:type I restriction enzyme S subunit [Salinibacter ruber]|uniref:restriction endonuclease subunit S n=1 Tax=Salinibacter ruber TaxID=146919 RepID=UPI0021691542|nr:restriction endonuclease subunit S [Salinibacter ruber]MCS3655211.1 type I restriction enzyme S subunit [Salinibacter ruber]
MTLQTLLDRFDLLMDTPESVPKLRRFILRLALQGRLTEQRKEDIDVNTLIERLRTEKQRLYDEGEIRKPRSLDPLDGGEEWHQVPFEWKWTKVGEVGRIIGGSTPRTSNDEYWADQGIAWLTPGDLGDHDGKMVARGDRDISEKGLDSCSATLLPPGSVLFSSRAPIGYVAIAADELSTNQGFKSVRPYEMAMSHYIYWFLKYAGKRINDEASGTTFTEVSGTDLANIPFPLPPLEEQQRIVQTVDGLMDECDALEEQQERERTLQVQVGSAATEALQSADGADALRSAWERVRGHFDTVTATPEGVDALRQTILQLAVQGRLTERDPDDVPAEVILKKLGSDVADESTRSHLPSLPEGWRWAALKNLLSNLRNGYSKAPRAESGTPVLRISAVRPLSVDLDDVRFLQERPDDFEKYLARPGDLLFIRYNGNKGLVGACAVVPSSVDKIGHPDKLIRGEVQRPDLTVPHYIAIALNCGKSRQHIDKKSKTTAGNYGISQTDLRSTPVPVPPAEEQVRMVGVVNQLLPFCDDLESLLPEAQKCSGQLLETALNDVGLDRRDTVPSQAAA